MINKVSFPDTFQNKYIFFVSLIHMNIFKNIYHYFQNENNDNNESTVLPIGHAL